MPTLDVAISTANNWPNVQSILNREGGPGQVFWIETAEARSRRWCRGAKALLQERGYELQVCSFPQEADHDAAIFAQTLIQALPAENFTPHLHLNGGTKWMQVMLSQALPSARIHYIEGERRTFMTEEGWGTDVHHVQPDLADILLCYGYARCPALFQTGISECLDAPDWSEPFRLWQTTQFKTKQEKLQGFESNFRRDLKKLLERGTLGLSRDGNALLDWLSSSEARDIFFRSHAFPGERLAKSWHSLLLQADWWVGYHTGQWKRPGEGPGWGHRFEKQAGEALAPYAPIWDAQALHANWRLVDMEQPDRDHAEIDHLWLLKSGRTVVFECKAWGEKREDDFSTRKDLAARLQNYRSCLGSLSSMVLCIQVSSRLNPGRIDTIRELSDSLRLPEPLWVGETPEAPFRVTNGGEILPPLAEQMRVLRASLRL